MSHRKIFSPLALLMVVSLVASAALGTGIASAKPVPTESIVPPDPSSVPDCPVPYDSTNGEAGESIPGPCDPNPPIPTSSPTSTPGPIVPDLTNFVQVQNGHIYLNGKPFRHVGANMPSLLYVLWYQGEGAFRSELQALQNAGIKHIRVFLANDRLNTLQIASNLQNALNIIAQYDIRVTVAFTDYHAAVMYADYPDNLARYVIPGDNVPAGATLDNTWVESGYQANYLPFVTFMVSQFATNPTVFAWEIGNEIKYVGGNGSALLNFYLFMAGAIQQVDPNHLVGTGIANTEHAGITEPAFIQALYSSANIDFITIHPYVRSLSDVVPAAWPDMGLASQFNKPLIVEEFGVSVNLFTSNPQKPFGRFVRDVYWNAFQQPGVDAVLQWGGALVNDFGNTDAEFGPLQQGRVPQYVQLWQQLADQLLRRNENLSCPIGDLTGQNDRWKLTIWNNQDLSGSPVERRYDLPDFDSQEFGFPYTWGYYGPSFCTGWDHYSVRFERNVNFQQAGRYYFTTYTDDGVRLWVAGTLLIDQWHDMAPTQFTASIYLTPGLHEIRLDYYENGGGALADLRWSLGPTGEPLRLLP